MSGPKVAVVVGTRPDIIKIAPLVRYFELHKFNYFIIHTGQHYSYELDRIFFEELQLPQPKYPLEIKSLASHRQGYHVGKILLEMEPVLLDESPDVVLIHGDTNSALGGALLASKISTTKEWTGYGMKIGHVEAGLRSFDRTMTEEINRVVCDHLSDYLFAPTETARQNLLNEGIDDGRIFVVGNTIVDAVLQNLAIAEKKSKVLDSLKLSPKGYFLVTLHRQENVDSKEKFRSVLDALAALSSSYGMPVVYPIHPRSVKMMEQFGFARPAGVTFIEPLGFLDFLQLEANAKLVLTDSGGVQEECCILKVPCVTLRENTERPETLEIGANILAGTDREKILASVKKMLSVKPDWKNPFGDGNAAEAIVKVLVA